MDVDKEYNDGKLVSIKIRPTKKGARGIALSRLKDFRGCFGNTSDDHINITASRSHLTLLLPATEEKESGEKMERLVKFWTKKRATLAELVGTTGFLKFRGTLEFVKTAEATLGDRLELLD